MLPTSAGTAFSMVSVTNGKGVTAGTPVGTPCWKAFLRWNPLLEHLLEPLLALETPSSGPFQRWNPFHHPFQHPLRALPPPPLVLPFPLIETPPPRYRHTHSAASRSTTCNIAQCIHVLHPMAPPLHFSPKSKRLQ